MNYIPDWTQDKQTQDYLDGKHYKRCLECERVISGEQAHYFDDLCEECYKENKQGGQE